MMSTLNLSKNLRSAFFLTTIFLSSLAFANIKAIVVMKDQAAFSRIHQGVLQRSTQLSQVFGRANIQGRIQHSLENLSILIVDVPSEAELNKISQMPQVDYVEKEVFHPAPAPIRGLVGKTFEESREQRVGMPTRPWGIDAIKAPNAWAQSGKGAGARILILDTGIDRNHPALKDNFEKGQDFVGDGQAAPYPYFDGEGHGSHVAGTIGGAELQSGFTGVAPKAKLLMGRVCSSLGCTNTAIAQGINWGIAEKVSAISMSLGGAFSTASEKKAIQDAETAGVVVVAASGNSGTPTVSFPAALPGVIAVGAVNSELKKTEFSQWGPELSIMAPGASVISSVPQGTGRESKVQVNLNGTFTVVNSTSFTGAKDVTEPSQNTLVFAGLGKPEDFAKVNVAGKFALVQRGEIKFLEKAQNAVAAKAAGIVIFNNTIGLTQGALTSDGSTLPIPVAMIEKTVGEDIAARLQAGKSVDVIIQTEKSDYAGFDGTSMATPHVAGVVALMKGANPKLTPAQVREIIKKTATPLSPNDQNQTGAGLINAEKAVAMARQL